MSVIVRDDGFHPDDWAGGFQQPTANDEPVQTGVELSPDTVTDPDDPRLLSAAIIRVDFPTFADGRGFSIARKLRRLGYTGRLRAAGHVIADQYAMARRCGFDEVEISDDLAKRQDEAQWRARANWQAHDYQARLRTAS